MQVQVLRRRGTYRKRCRSSLLRMKSRTLSSVAGSGRVCLRSAAVLPLAPWMASRAAQASHPVVATASATNLMPECVHLERGPFKTHIVMASARNVRAPSLSIEHSIPFPRRRRAGDFGRQVSTAIVEGWIHGQRGQRASTPPPTRSQAASGARRGPSDANSSRPQRPVKAAGPS